jgi:hypothetical protein
MKVVLKINFSKSLERRCEQNYFFSSFFFHSGSIEKLQYYKNTEPPQPKIANCDSRTYYILRIMYIDLLYSFIDFATGHTVTKTRILNFFSSCAVSLVAETYVSI